MAMAALALIITIPALKGAPGTVFPVAFFAVVSICVIGLYIAYVIPIFLRWRMGDEVRAGEGLEPRQQVAVDEPDQLHLGRDHLHRRPACRRARSAVPWDDQFDCDLRQLRAARADRS